MATQTMEDWSSKANPSEVDEFEVAMAVMDVGVPSQRVRGSGGSGGGGDGGGTDTQQPIGEH